MMVGYMTAGPRLAVDRCEALPTWLVSVGWVMVVLTVLTVVFLL